MCEAWLVGPVHVAWLVELTPITLHALCGEQRSSSHATPNLTPPPPTHHTLTLKPSYSAHTPAASLPFLPAQVSASYDGQISVWDIAAGAVLHRRATACPFSAPGMLGAALLPVHWCPCHGSEQEPCGSAAPACWVASLLLPKHKQGRSGPPRKVFSQSLEVARFSPLAAG